MGQFARGCVAEKVSVRGGLVEVQLPAGRVRSSEEKSPFALEGGAQCDQPSTRKPAGHLEV